MSSIHDIHDHTQSDIGKDVEVIVADPLNINNQYSIGTFKFSQLLRENGRMVQSKATKTKVGFNEFVLNRVWPYKTLLVPTNYKLKPKLTLELQALAWILILYKLYHFKAQLQELVRRFCSAKELMFVTEGKEE